MLDAGTMAEAFAEASPMIYADGGLGGIAFANWASTKMRWKDVVVAKDETTFGKARKDIRGERGKRLCRLGRIVHIKALRGLDRDLFEGFLNTLGGDTQREEMFTFVAAGTTGDLVDNSPARFCGVVVDAHDWDEPTKPGGRLQVVELVGMFDLPANRDAGL